MAPKLPRYGPLRYQFWAVASAKGFGVKPPNLVYLDRQFHLRQSWRRSLDIEGKGCMKYLRIGPKDSDCSKTVPTGPWDSYSAVHRYPNAHMLRTMYPT
jgi:hypothetical protein